MNDVSIAAATLGRKGGSSRSKAKIAASRRNIARARKSLTPEQRRERAQAAARARWSRVSSQSDK